MRDPNGLEYPTFRTVNGWPTELLPVLGAACAITAACLWGLPTHAVVGFAVMLVVTAFGVNIGLHRLFSHRSFATSRPVERGLLVLGCIAGQSAPFFWVATHRKHHRHSDRDGDPHSPYVSGQRRFGLLRGLWHAHFFWLHTHGYGYEPAAVRDLAQRPDLAWIDRNWFLWYLVGLAVPAAAGLLIGGTAYDALVGLLWGGLLRQFVALQATFAINSLAHVWGGQAFEVGDDSRNNTLLGLLVFGEGWHNNHHAHPYSARHGFRWWQLDAAWCLIWCMERVGLVWRVKRPKLALPAVPPAGPSTAAAPVPLAEAGDTHTSNSLSQ